HGLCREREPSSSVGQPGQCREADPHDSGKRPIAAEARLGLLVRQIEQHYNEEVKNQDGASIHDDLYCCEEFCPQQQENACHVQEQCENPEHVVHGISPRDGQKCTGDTSHCHVIE